MKTIKEFIEQRQNNPNQKIWIKHENNLLKQLENLKNLIHKEIINKILQNYNTKLINEDVQLSIEGYKYTLPSFIIECKSNNHDDEFNIVFNPVGCMIMGANGRYDVSLDDENYISVLLDLDNNWKIIDYIDSNSYNRSLELVDFTEENIIKRLTKIK